MCHTVFMTAVETRDFFCQRKCSRSKAPCRDKNAGRMTSSFVSPAPPNNQPLGEFREDWGLQQLLILELQDPYRSWAEIWDRSPPTLLGPHRRRSCPVDLCQADTFFFCFLSGGEKERRRHPGQEMAHRDVPWESTSLPVLTAAQ